jgi:hypothetical protein
MLTYDTLQLILRVDNQDGAEDFTPFREEQSPRIRVFPPTIRMVSIRRGYRYELDAWAEEPKNDGGSSRMICRSYQKPRLANSGRRAIASSIVDREL